MIKARTVKARLGWESGAGFVLADMNVVGELKLATLEGKKFVVTSR